VLRQMRWKRPEQYLAKAAAGTPIQQEFAIAAVDLPFEFMLNALRLQCRASNTPLFAIAHLACRCWHDRERAAPAPSSEGLDRTSAATHRADATVAAVFSISCSNAFSSSRL
jgi:hypothetical protein